MLLEHANPAHAALIAGHGLLHRVCGHLTEDIVAANWLLLLLGRRIEKSRLRVVSQRRTLVLIGILNRKWRSYWYFPAIVRLQDLIEVSALVILVQPLEIEDVPCACHLLREMQ